MPAKDIKGYEGLYQITSDGKVISYKNTPQGRILSEQLNTKGYPSVRLYSMNRGKTFAVHRLVAEAFLPREEDRDQVDHINDNKRDNGISNLRWVDNQTNTSKALSKVFYLLHKNGTGYFIKNLNKWCRDEGYDQASFFKMKNGQRKSAYGFNHMEAAYSS